MTPQNDDAEGVPLGGTQSRSGRPESAPEPARRHSRALLALVAAGTLATAPIAGSVIGLAGNVGAAHSSPVFLLAEVSHDVGHNDWAFQSNIPRLVIWAVTYVALAVAWLTVALWLRSRDRSGGPQGPQQTTGRLWLRLWIVVLAVEFAAGVLTIGAVLYAQWTATSLGPVALRLADACSPWWSCVAALAVVARAERNTVALRAALAYGAVLAVLLLVPLPGPNIIKVLVLAATAAIPALLDQSESSSLSITPRPIRSDAAAAD
jgi:hypothetical protein